jgi:hypothetical protein
MGLEGMLVYFFGSCDIEINRKGIVKGKGIVMGELSNILFKIHHDFF